ncbi:MAG: hypothetical protein GTO63_15750 [Anaerolineae bacterium]|nr:hypothetical protein [Anaerolineae bacterium]NIN96283.1 hypothetical protein [Anaerolineae bacterium]NIQ79303.1 hypothetical protein [Anaerolineae bacterium]
MTDEVETDVDDAPEQDSPDSEVEVDDSAELADSEEDETQADDTEEDDTGEETDDEEEDEPAQVRSPAFQKLLDKYGGDEEALVNAYFEQANSASRLHKEIEGLKEFLLKQQDTEEPISEDPDVKSLSEELQGLSQEVDAIQQEQMHLVGQYGQVENDIKILEADAAKAEDYEKAAIKTQIAGRKAELTRLLTTINQGRREMNRLARDQRNLERQRKQAEQAVQSRREVAKKKQLRDASVASLTRDEFNQSMRDEAQKYGIRVDSKQFQLLNNSIRTTIANHLGTLPKDAPGINISYWVTNLMKEHADAWGMKPSFAKKSEAVRKRTPVTSGPKPRVEVELPKGLDEPKPPKSIEMYDKRGNWTVEYAKYRARQLSKQLSRAR